MDILDAAATVLRDAGEPLHYRELSDRMLERRLWTTEGMTPWNTVTARIGQDIKRRGASSHFIRLDQGRIALRGSVTVESDSESEGDQPRSESEPAAKGMSFTDAAEWVLGESGDQEPLHYAEIAKQALEGGLIQTEGRTPAATMYSMILTEIRRREDRNESPRFVRHGRGVVGLASWLPDQVASLIEERNSEVRQALLAQARSASPDDFESLVEQLLVAMGFEGVAVTPSSGDGGIDVRGTLVVGRSIRIRMAVQAKRWKNNVQKPVVQQVRGSLGAHEQGLIITTSDFSAGAKEEAQRSDTAPVALIGGEQLAVLLAEHEIGARMTSYELYTLDEVDSSEE